jgi:polysaccharide transporter, PST family
MDFNKTSLNDVIATVTSNAIPIVLALEGWGYWALVAKWVILPLAITVGAWIMCGWRPGLPGRGAGVKPMLKYAFHTYGNFIMSYLRRNIDKILIGRFFGIQPLGYYDRAYHLSSILPTQIIGPLYSVAVSTFSRLSDDPEKYIQTYLKVLSILAFVGMPMSAVLTLISHDVVYLLLGPKWNSVVPMFFAFSLSIGVAIIYVTHGWLHLSLGTPDRWFRWSIVEFIVTAFCFILGLPYGALGIAVAFSASFYILIGPALWYAGRSVHLKVSSVVLTIWRYFFSALAAGLMCWYLLFSYGITADIFIKLNILIRMSVTAILCASLYLILIIAVFGSTKPVVQFTAILREIINDRTLSKQVK